MLEILYKNGLSMEKFDAVLDFGCGIGRVIRHLRNVHGPCYYGTDYNPKLIAWCRHNLKFARFSTNHLVGKLGFKEGNSILFMPYPYLLTYAKSNSIFGLRS